MNLEYWATVIGAVLIVEGIPWFLSPDKTKQFLSQVHLLNNRQLRLYGLVLMLIGLLVVRFATL